MEIINAIAKARFASSRPQCVQLHKDDAMAGELVCMEPGQDLTVASGRWLYYIIKGQARIATPEDQNDLAPGQVAALAPGEKHCITNIGEQRLICFAVGQDT